MNIELNVFDKNELIRACQLTGYKNKDGLLSNNSAEELKKMILKKINPDNNDVKEQYLKSLDLFKIEHSTHAKENVLRNKLYEHTCKNIEKAISKMSKKKKEKLAAHIEKSMDPTALDDLRKAGKKGMVAGGGVLALQGGAILLMGSNLGICMLLTTGLSGISGLLGITFPFAAYTGAAVFGGWVLGVAGFLASPYIVVPVLGYTGYNIFKNIKNKQYVNLAGVNYLIESKKALDI